MHAELERSGDTTLVTVGGEIDLDTAARLQALLDDAVGARPARLVVDLDAVTFLPSLGLTALATVSDAARREGVTLRVVASSRAVLRPLQITGLDEEITVVGSRAEALDSDRPIPPE